MCFAFSAAANQHLSLLVWGWKPRLRSAQTSNSGLGCDALKELVRYGEDIDTIFHNGGKTSSLAICQKVIVIKAPSRRYRQVTLRWLTQLVLLPSLDPFALT